MRQIRRAKPTFNTAHEYHRVGSHGTGPEHWVDDHERQAIADGIGDELLELVKTEFPRTQNLEYALLKAHLIVEHSLVQYIRCMSRLLVEPSELKRFTFAQKLEIARLMGFGAHDPVIVPTVERLNQVRNQVAHSFALDRPLLDEMIRVNSADYDDFAMANDRERIRRLRWICFAIAGRTAGEVSASAYISGRASHALKRDLGGD